VKLRGLTSLASDTDNRKRIEESFEFRVDRKQSVTECCRQCARDRAGRPEAVDKLEALLKLNRFQRLEVLAVMVEDYSEGTAARTSRARRTRSRPTSATWRASD
jgi:hypothetical protein